MAPASGFERRDADWVAQHFGAESVRPKSQDMDAGAAALTVYFVQLLPGFDVNPDQVLATVKRFKVEKRGELTLYKAGNTLVVWGSE